MAGMRLRWRALPTWVRDGLLALALTIAGQVELLLLAGEVAGPAPLQHVAFAGMTGALVARRIRPVAAAGVAAAALAFQTLLGEAPAVSGFVAVLVVVYSVAHHASRRRDAAVGLLLVVAAIQVYPFVAEDVRVADEIGNTAIPVIIWVFARLARERLDRAVAAEREASQARLRVREEELAREAAVAAERRRIARELHDVVGHGVTLMLLHADAAQASLAGREPATARALDVVLTSGRTALADLHRMLRLLRDADADGEPPGSLDDLPRLVEAARATGIDVDLTVAGRRRALPGALEATAYRIVQEGLTNVLRHAGPVRARVVLHYTDQALEVEIEDDGRADEHGSGRGRAGFGLAGIRERVALFEGAVSAGPRTDGRGWRVRAVLPAAVSEPAPV